MDDIRRRLAEIDKQLARGPIYYHQQIITTAPLLFCSVGMMAGIVIQNYLSIPVWVWLLAAVCTTISIASLVTRRLRLVRDTNHSYIIPYLALVCFACVGAIRLASFNRPKLNDIRKFVGNEPNSATIRDLIETTKDANLPKLASIRGVIETEPYIEKQNWQFAKFKYSDLGSSFYLRVTEAEMTTGWAKTTGLVRVRVNEPLMDLKAGDYVQMYCWLDRFKNATNPGEFDLAKYLARKGVFVGASVESRQAIELLQTEQGRLLTRIRTRLSAVATDRLAGELPTEDPTRGLVEALLLGSRSNISKDVYRSFEETGLLHFISLSGMHLAIIAGIAWWLAKLAGLMKRGQATVCIITVVVFVLTVPPRDPTIRAAIIVIVFCASFFFRRRPSSLNSLSLAAIILLLARPTGLFEAGWQLSFVSVLGILAFGRRIHFFLYNKIAGHPWIKDSLTTRPFFKIVARPGPAILALFTTGLSAWVGSAGILLYHFYTINPLTSIWTVAAFPFVALILTFGFLKILFSFALPTLAGLLGSAVSLLAAALIWIVKFIAGLNISEILIGHTPIWLIFLYYALVLFAGFCWFKRPMPKRIIFTVTAIAILTYLGAIKWQRMYREDLTVTVLDVGHGQAVLAEMPGQTNILFDAGSSSRDDIGTRAVLPFLRYKGIGKIDSLLISHGDIDHINGIPEVNDDCRIEFFYANKAFKQENKPTVKFLQTLIAVKDINAMSEAIGPVKIKTLWPDSETCQNNQISSNDKSTVTMIEYAGRRVLICSDIEKFAQGELLRLYPDLKADVVIAPHHGSAKTTQRSFLEKLGPEVIITSCTKTACEKGQVIKLSKNISSYYTGTDGTVMVSIDKNGLTKVNRFTKEK